MEIEPDAMCVNSRFTAEHTLVGDVAECCKELTKRIRAINKDRQRHKAIARVDSKSRRSMTPEQIRDMWDYMVNGSPNIVEVHVPGPPALKRISTPEIEQLDPKNILDDTDALWDEIHNKKVSGSVKFSGNYRR